MQRYNPPTTSQQAICHGCNRQIRKVQEVMNEQYITAMNARIEQRKLEDIIRALQRQVDLERVQKKNMKMLYDNKMIAQGQRCMDGGVNDETLRSQNEHLMKVNEDLMQEVERLKEAAKQKPAPLPFDEYRRSLEEYYEEKIERITDKAYDNKEMAEYFQREFEKKDQETKEYRRSLRSHRLTIKNLSDKIEALENEDEEEEDVKRRKESDEDEEMQEYMGNGIKYD